MTLDFITYEGELYVKVRTLSESLNDIAASLMVTGSTSQPLTLRFFTSFNTPEKQDRLREAIRSLAREGHAYSGKDLISLYIADSYFVGAKKLRGRYGDFCSDIDVLVPGFLVKAEQSQATNTLRYKKYIQMLTRECHKWFILDGKLPPLEEWTSKIYVYHVSVNTRRNVQQETASMLRRFR